MRRLILLFTATASMACYAQDSSWVSLSYPEFGFAWQMPAQPTILDTLNVRMYALELDSGMAVTVHFIKDVLPDTSAGSLYQAAFDVEGDTLRAMAQVMLATANGALLSIADTSNGAWPALDMVFGIMQEPAEESLTIIRMYYYQRRFITAGLHVPKNRELEGLAIMSALRSTIQLLQP